MLQASRDRRPPASRDPADLRMPGLAVALHIVGVLLFLAGLLGGSLSAIRLFGAADILGQLSALIPDRPADMLGTSDARIAALADMIGDGPGLRRQLVVQAWLIGGGAVAAGLILWLLCAGLASALHRLNRIEARLSRPG
jgi:HAMP domain-containing protein